jgi:hypothetical protein
MAKAEIHGPRIDVPTDPPSHRLWVCYTARDRIGGVMASILASDVVNREFCHG